MRLLIRLLQRMLIFGLGIFCVWLIVFVVFETADRRLPWILAVGVTYGIAAYIILPRAIRVGLASHANAMVAALRRSSGRRPHGQMGRGFRLGRCSGLEQGRVGRCCG